MHFAYPLPWWLAVLLAAAIGALAFVEYRRPLAPLTPRAARRAGRRCACSRSRRSSLFLFRPIVLLPPASSRDAVVPVLVDVSRSMRLADADGQTRLARATSLLKTELLPALSRQFTTEIYSVGDGARAGDRRRRCAPTRGGRDLAGALAARARALSRPARRRHRAAVGRRRHGRRTRRTAAVGDGQRAAGVRRRRRLARRSARSRGARHHRRRSAARSRVGRSARHRRSAAASAARRFSCACSPTARCSTRGGSCRRPTDRRSTRCSRSRPIR